MHRPLTAGYECLPLLVITGAALALLYAARTRPNRVLKSKTCSHWAELSPDVVKQTASLLSSDDCWGLREVCKQWGAVAQQVACFVVYRFVTTAELVIKLRQLFKWRRSRTYPKLNCTFSLRGRISLRDLQSLLKTLSKEGHVSTACQIRIILSHEQRITQLVPSARQVALRANALKAHGISLAIDLQQPVPGDIDFCPGVLQHLAPFLNNVVLSPIPSDLVIHRVPDEQVGWGPDHIMALQNATSLKTLYVLGKDDVSISSSLSVLNCCWTTLSIVHLDLSDADEANFEPLSQLSRIQSLALLCYHDMLDCQGILHSSRDTLAKVTLAGLSYTPESYKCLQHLPQLEKVTIKIRDMDLPGTLAIAGVKSAAVNILFSDCDGAVSSLALGFLSVSSEVCELVLRHANDQCCETLWRYSHLEKLTIVRGVNFSGTGLYGMNMLQQVTFIDCPDVTVDALGVIVHTAPLLQLIAFHASQERGPGHLRLSSAALKMLANGPNLKYIDLRGIAELEPLDIVDMHWAFYRMQNLLQAQPVVTVWVHYPQDFDECLASVHDECDLDSVVLFRSDNLHRVYFLKGRTPGFARKPRDLGHYLFTDNE